MQTQDLNRAAFEAYVGQLGRHIDAYRGINPFWAKIYEGVASEGVAGSADEVVAKINKAPMAGYLVEPFIPETLAAKWTKVEWALAAFDKSGVNADLPSGVTIEVLFVAWFLREQGALEDARALLDQARLAPTYGNLRHCYYARQIEAAVHAGPIDALEIGAGGSALKLILRAILGERLRSYTIVDLPQMLCLSITAALSYFPAEPIGIGVEQSVGAPHGFIPAGDAAELAERPARFNLAINTHSFQEMDAGVIAGYFDLIYATATPGALFFNTNWSPPAMTRLDGSTYHNDATAYPYRPLDQVLFDGPDPLQEALRHRFRFKAKMANRTSIRRISSGE